MSSAVLALTALRESPGTHLKVLDTTFNRLSTEFCLRVTDEMKMHFQLSVRSTYIDKLVENLEARFVEPDLFEAMLRFFDPSKASHEKNLATTDFSNYADAEVGTAVNTFPRSMDKVKVELEWTTFKHVLVGRFADCSPDGVMTCLSSNDSLASA